MNLIKKLNLKFSDAKMEKEFTGIQDMNIMIDFRVALIGAMLVTMTVSIRTIIVQDMVEFTIASSTIFVIAVIFCLGNIIKKKINLLILAVLFLYNLYRLLVMIPNYSKITGVAGFNGGYTYAILQMIFISRIRNVYHTILSVIACYVMRFGLMYGLIDRSSFDIGALVRVIIVDAIIIYYFYGTEKTGRKVFQNFCNYRDELLRFKDLLEHSLPQSVIVLDYFTKRSLFSNKMFLSLFEYYQSHQDSPSNIDSHHSPLTTSRNKPNFDFLNVELSTIRDEDTSKTVLDPATFPTSILNLKDVIIYITENNCILDKTLSLTASSTYQQDHKSFQVILKRIKWDTADAIAIILNDITYQKNLIALSLANANKDKVIATVSHELRTPLGGILGLIGLAEELVTNSEALEYLALSKDNINLLLSLVNSHLDLQMMSAGKLRLNPSPINLQKVLNNIIRLFHFQIDQKGIYLKSVISKDISNFIITDENRLKQILINLVGNAIKFTFSGGIQIEVVQDPQDKKSLQISVRDTGLGIKDEDKEKLFQAYGKLEEGRSVNKNGIGLGLTIANALALLLSGNKPEGKGIEVMSKHGSGSCFYFKILKNLNNFSEQEIQMNNKDKNGMADGNRSSEELNLQKQNLESNKAESEEERSQVDHEKESLGSDYCEESLVPFNINSKISSHVSLIKINIQDINDRHKTCKSPVNQTYVENKVKSIIEDPAHELGIPIKTKTEEDEDEDEDELKKTKAQIRIDTACGELSQNNFALVVDDNSFNLLIISNYLRDLRYEVKTAMNGQEAIQMIKSCNDKKKIIKIIFMDCQMPIMDGYQATIILKDMMDKKEIPYVPIVALTASTSEQDVKKCYESRMEGYLIKPLSKESLLKELKRLEGKNE